MAERNLLNDSIFYQGAAKTYWGCVFMSERNAEENDSKRGQGSEIRAFGVDANEAV